MAAVEWTDKRTNTPPRLQDAFLADEFETEGKRLDKDLGLAESGKLHPGHLSVAQEGLFILTGAYAGLRIGEVAGLRLGRLHLDPPNPFIEVVEAAAEVNGVVTFGEPKTEGSRRAVPIPQWLADALEVLWIGDFATMSRPSPQDFAFTTPHGHPWPRTRFAARVWKPAVKLAQIDPPTNFHDLRRAYASMLIAAGLNPKVSRPGGATPASGPHSTVRSSDARL